MSSARAAKKRKAAPPTNHSRDVSVYAPDRVREAIGTLQCGLAEVVIIDAGINPACPGAEMVQYWNARVKPEFRVPIPKQWTDITMRDYKVLPGITGGMWHAYATSAHDAALDSPIIHTIFQEITGTPNWKIRPNRIRFNGVNNNEGYTTAHIEGPHVLTDRSGISAILCMSAGRTFTYYKGSNNDQRARRLFLEHGGRKSLFVQLRPEQTKHWERTTISTTGPGQIILFADSVIHESSRLGKNTLSLFLSPYNPEAAVSEIDFYEGLTRKQAIEKQRKSKCSPPLPSRMRTPGCVRQHPKEFCAMSRRDTEIFGSLFHITGYCWPSNKLTFFMMHMMAFNAFQHKLLPFCFDSNGKFNYEVITASLVASCPEFDQEYFDRLPLANITTSEKEAMRARFTGIPDAAWPLIKYWTKDPRKCSENVCMRRDYIKQ